MVTLSTRTISTTPEVATEIAYVIGTTTIPVPRKKRDRRNAVDRKMAQPIVVKWQTVVLTLLRIPTFLPFLFIAPAVFAGNGAALDAAEADVLGTGSEILLILTLLVTPIVTLTGWRWLVPMRRWYGIMFGLSAITDGIVASITTGFAGGPVGRVAGHTFLLVGLMMIVILIPLMLTANNRAQRWLGKYWKVLQRLTYVVWGLLLVHLALLEGFGFQRGANGPGAPNDGLAVFHQRLYQFAAVSLFLVTLRLPPVKRWIAAKQEAGEMRRVWLTLSPLIMLFLVGYLFIEHEFFFKGINLFKLTPSDE